MSSSHRSVKRGNRCPRHLQRNARARAAEIAAAREPGALTRALLALADPANELARREEQGPIAMHYLQDVAAREAAKIVLTAIGRSEGETERLTVPSQSLPLLM